MNEDFVSFEIAKKLKEKGFDKPCMNAINRFRCTYANGWCEYLDDRAGEFITQGDLKEGDYLLPTIPKVLKWLRVARNFHVSPDLVSDYSVDADGNICEEWTYWSYSIHHITDGPIYRDYNQFDHIEYKSWEDASLAGINHVLDNLI